MGGLRIFACIVAMLPFGGAFASPGDCTPRAADRIRQIDLAVPRDTRVTRTVDIPADTAVLIEAFEKGINSRIEVREPGGPPRVADTPINRWTPKRLVLERGAARRVQVAVVGMERSLGHALLAFYPLDAGGDPRCVEFRRAMAAADAEYAAGELITNGAPGAEGNSNRLFELAARHYARAAQLSGGKPGTPQAQAQLAFANVVLTSTERFRDAADAALDAQRRFEAIGDGYGRDRARFFWARATMQRGRHGDKQADGTTFLATARKSFLEVAGSHALRGERYDQGVALHFAAFTSGQMDRFAESIEEYRVVLRVFEDQDEPARKVQARQNIAHAEYNLGRYQQALKHQLEALADADPVNESEIYIYILKNVATTERTLGKYDDALRRYSEALAFSKRTQHTRLQAFALEGIGNTYQAIGNFPEALAYLQRALEMRPASELPIERASTLRGIADVLSVVGRPKEALAQREAAVRLPLRDFDKARVRAELVGDRITVGDLAVAKQEIAALLAAREIEDPVLRARVTLEQARLALAERRFDSAAREARSATAMFRSLELVNREFDAVMLQARVACATNRREDAFGFADRALQLAEEIRLSSNNPTLRASLWKPLRPAFAFTIGAHARAGACGGGRADPLAALAIAERSRSRALGDFRRAVGGPARQRPESASRRDLFEQMAARRHQIETLSASVPHSDARLQFLREDVAQLRRQIDLAGGGAELASTRASNLEPALRKRLDAIPEGTAIVEYWLGEPDAYAWLLTRGRVQMVDLGPSAAIDSAARSLHAAMRSWTSGDAALRTRAARELHRRIIEPLPEEFARTRVAYFVPDGALHTVPFAALAVRAGTEPRFLVDTHDVAVAPSFFDLGGSTTSRPTSRQAAALVIADPVYTQSDPRFGIARVASAAETDAAPTFRGTSRAWSRLPATAREAKSISGLLAPGAVQVMSGFDASRDALLARDLAGFDILHFAVHAVADTEAPQLSALILSTYDANGRPRIGEVFAGDLLDKRIDAGLVVLSGCETALGQATVGEGLLGMRYAAHAAGARTVVASLWPVMDAAGARLMDDFYAGAISRNQSAVVALSQAMRRVRRQMPDPALWAAFDVSIAGF
jgi:CHAT domain-containing protein